ncbi:MAG: cytochrome c-type biogenesis protein [Flavobacteriales bacterium]|jgi:cytochrome c-type biogenesis protein
MSMTIEYSAIPLAFLAGMLGILSPCVWPLVPIVMSASARSALAGKVALAAGLSVSFALAGSVLSFFLISFSINPEFFRYLAASLLVLVAFPLMINSVGVWLTDTLAKLTRNYYPQAPQASVLAQFSIGCLLGLVWLPCVGPTLGAAIALASMGQEIIKSFVVMLSYGAGAALALAIAALTSNSLFYSINSNLALTVEKTKILLGGLIFVLGLLVLSGWDKLLEGWALTWLPSWMGSL